MSSSEEHLIESSVEESDVTNQEATVSELSPLLEAVTLSGCGANRPKSKKPSVKRSKQVKSVRVPPRTAKTQQTTKEVEKPVKGTGGKGGKFPRRINPSAGQRDLTQHKGTVLVDLSTPSPQYHTPTRSNSYVNCVVAANSLLHQKVHEVKSQPVRWQSYASSQMITQEDFNFLSAYEQATTPEQRKELLSNDQVRQQCAKTFCTLLPNISKDQTVHYLLILVDDMLEDDPDNAEIFREFTLKRKESVYTPFLNLLGRANDLFGPNMSARIISKIACHGRNRMTDPDLTRYLTWLRDQLRMANNEYVQSAARCLQMMLRIDDYRAPFDAVDGITAIVETLRIGNMNFQMQYQCTFCLWVLAFNPQICVKMSRMNIVPVLADLLTSSQKEKVTRIVLATLRNFLEKPQETSIIRENSIAMIQCKVLKNLINLQQNPREDPDVVEDIDYLVEKLQILEQDMSSFDEYVNEVKTGRLEWSPVHTSEKFWRESCEKLNEKNYELLKMLITLLENSDPLIVTVAAHDLGEYVRHYPRGKQVIEKLNGKHRVMQLLSHADPNVRYEALLCVQKLMVHNWEYLGKQMQSDNQTGKGPGRSGLIKAN